MVNHRTIAAFFSLIWTATTALAAAVPTATAPAAPAVVTAPAVGDEPAPEPEQWLKQVHLTGQESGRYLSSLVLADAVWEDGSVDPTTIDLHLLRQQSLVEVPAARDLQWALKINARAFADGTSPGQRVASFQTMANADAILCLADDDHPDLTLQMSDGKTLKTLASLHPPSTVFISGTSLGAALHTMLGYDAVVLDQRGRWVLVQAPELQGMVDVHAVALGESAELLTLPSAKPHGIGLLELVKSSGHYAVFRLTSAQSADPLPYGTKLILGPQFSGW